MHFAETEVRATPPTNAASAIHVPVVCVSCLVSERFTASFSAAPRGSVLIDKHTWLAGAPQTCWMIKLLIQALRSRERPFDEGLVHCIQDFKLVQRCLSSPILVVQRLVSAYIDNDGLEIAPQSMLESN